MLSISLVPAIVTSATLFAQYSLAGRPFYHAVFRHDSLASFIASETPISLKGILDNIGPNGDQVEGAASGLVIASPSKIDPDCTLPDFLLLVLLPVKNICLLGILFSRIFCASINGIFSLKWHIVTTMKMTKLTNSRFSHLEQRLRINFKSTD